MIKIGGKQDDITIISAFVQRKNSDSLMENIVNEDIIEKENIQNIKYFKEDREICYNKYRMSKPQMPIENNNLNSLKEI